MKKESSNIEIYRANDGELSVEVRLDENTVWLTQKQMASLFEKDTDTIGLHIKNIFSEGELSEDSTTEFFSVVQTEGKGTVNRKIKFYNLDIILSVGYRVSSKKGTQFRIWATQRLNEYLTMGYAINRQRLDQLQKIVEVIQK